MEQQELKELLKDFQGIFEEPVGLPPKRSCDHHILFNDGTQPISVRLDRCPFYQETGIETIVQDLLKARVVRPS